MTPTGARVFRAVNHGMLRAWRVGDGRMLNLWPSVAGRIMVLGHVGRRSGLLRRTPLNYAVVDGDVWCVAGFGAASDWYRNVLAQPQVEVWLPGQRLTGVAAAADDDPRRARVVRAVLVASGFAARAAGLRPDRLDDAALARAARDYRLVRIVPDEPVPAV